MRFTNTLSLLSTRGRISSMHFIPTGLFSSSSARRTILVSTISAFVAAGCFLSSASAQSAHQYRYYCGKGVIVSIDEDRSGVTLKHQRIDGFMEAMTMHFKTEEPSVLDDVKAGDAVRFTLKDSSERTRLIYIEKLPAAPGHRSRKR